MVGFTETELGKLPGQEGHALVYFRDTNPILSIVIIRRWLVWLAQSSVGKLDGNDLLDSTSSGDAKVSVSHFENMVSSPLGAPAYFNQPPPRVYG